MKKLVYLLLFTFFLYCCNKQSDCKGTIVDGPALRLILVSKGGSPLIRDYGTKYDAKYTKFENADGSKIGNYSISNGRIIFNLIGMNQNEKDTMFSTYYLKLPFPDTSFERKYDIDTIKTITKIESREGCNFYYLKELIIKYNDSVYYHSTNQFPPYLNLTKK